MPPVFYWIGEYIEMGLRWLSTQYWGWWAYFKIRALRLCKFLWNVFAVYAVVVFLSTATLTFWAYMHDMEMPPEKLSDLNTVTSIMIGSLLLGIGIAGFILIFILFTIFSSSKRGREIADNNFTFARPTESEQFKSDTERRLAALEKFKTETEKRWTASKDNAEKGNKKKDGKHKEKRR